VTTPTTPAPGAPSPARAVDAAASTATFTTLIAAGTRRWVVRAVRHHQVATWGRMLYAVAGVTAAAQAGTW
jgi:hypothetical protein